MWPGDGVLLPAAWLGVLESTQSLRNRFFGAAGKTHPRHLPRQQAWGSFPQGRRKRSCQPWWRGWATCLVPGRMWCMEKRRPTTTAVSVWGLTGGLASTQWPLSIVLGSEELSVWDPEWGLVHPSSKRQRVLPSAWHPALTQVVQECLLGLAHAWG